MNNWNIPIAPGTHIVISIPKEQGQEITVSTVECESTSLWDIIGEALKDSIKDIRNARLEARKIAPNLLSEIQ